LTPNELVLPFGGTYVCANFGENRSRNATARVLADGQIHTLTDANRFYNLSHAICYSYGTDNDIVLSITRIKWGSSRRLFNRGRVSRINIMSEQNPRSVESVAKLVARRRNTSRNCWSTSEVSRVWATVVSYNKLMWSGSSSVICSVVVFSVVIPVGSKAWARGFEL